MTTYLFIWNPEQWHWWDDLAETFAPRNGKRTGNWSTGVTKRIVAGDRFFLLRLGREPRGICASGFTTSNVYKGKHWQKERAKLREKSLYVDIEFDALRNPVREPILPLSELKLPPFKEFWWEAPSSGREIPAALARALERRWKRLLGHRFHPKPIADPTVFEGMRTETVIYSRGRSRKLRDHALQLAKGICEACRTDFGTILQGKGVQVLQVHHKKQFASTDQPRLTRVSDLAVLCANCHALVHFNPKQALKVSALRLMLASSVRQSLHAKRT